LVVGGAAYAALEPACLSGPYGQLNPALRPILLDRVFETKSVVALSVNEPTLGLAAVAFIFAGVAAQVALCYRQPGGAMGLAVVFTALAAVLGCWQLRLLSYGGWLAAVPLAEWAARLPGTRSLSAPVARLAAVLLLSQSTHDVGLSLLRGLDKTGETSL